MIHPLKHGLNFSPKVIILITAIIFFGCLDVAGADQGFDINIEITGATTGRVMASVYQLEDDTETHFLTTKTVFKISGQPDAAGKFRFTIPHLPNVKHAIAAFEDRNGDGELNTTLFGLPTEKFGFSQNAKATFGPPSFAEAAFLPKKTPELTIDLN
jgi:uncharacterized protein (DUF2141 family)